MVTSKTYSSMKNLLTLLLPISLLLVAAPRIAYGQQVEQPNQSADRVDAISGLDAATQLTLASPFTDNAVLQRDTPVPVWGAADSGTTVTVEFAGQKKSAVTEAGGKWELQLDPMPANAQPQILKVSNGASQVSLSNIVVGEVWICAGQSNMQVSAAAIPKVKALISKAKNIRSFEVKRTVAMTQQDRLQGKWVETHPNSAVAFSFAHFLQQAGDVPVGIILTCWGSSSIEAWMPRDMTETVPHFKTIMDEFDADIKTRDQINSILNGPIPWKRKDDIFLRRQPNVLYNAMMHPLVPYACRGVVWYQGERNTQSMFGMIKKPWFSRNSGMLKYGDTLTAWIERYRQSWNNKQMHFIVVMLPGFGKLLKTSPTTEADHPAAHSWAWIRESQLKSLKLQNTAVANTIDLGDVKNVHPKDKLPIGKRLALLAARNTLNQDIEAHGPTIDRAEPQGETLVVHFNHARGLKTLDGNAPTAFWLSDDSEKWFKAEAEINGLTVILNSQDIKTPRYVRYAFSGKPTVNLVNAAGLPAYPFRTDTFKP